MTLSVVVSGDGVTPADVVGVARGHDVAVTVAPAAIEAMAVSRAVVDRLARGEVPAYGISTGFGALANTAIPPERRADLQRSLVRSHAASTGDEVEREVIRAMMLLRLRTIATGCTGLRPETASLMAELLTHGITPIVGEFGSLGCSGDLAPLSHVALALMGEGRVRDASGLELPASEALSRAALTPVTLAEKEGLALINGTDGMLGMLLLAIADLDDLVFAAELAAAMSVEALLATDAVFAADLVGLRPQPGQLTSATNLRRALENSPIVASHRGGEDTRVQDAYSIRCAPQVAGAVRDTIEHARTVATAELRSAIDNPVVLPDGRISSNGNFHGAPIGYVLDFLAIAVADLASIAERRTDRMLDAKRSYGLPAFLAHDPGVDSGLMIAHYTQAGLVSECKRLAVPASVDSIPTSAMQEDHVSMGWAAGRKLRRSVDALRRVIAIEMLAAARAIELRAPLQPAEMTGRAVAAIRTRVPGVGPDRELAPQIAAVTELLADGSLLAATQGA